MGNNNWNVSEPIDHTLIRAVPQEVRDVKSCTKHIILKEHVEPSTGGVGGQHLQGSCKVYLSSTAPTTDPEANNLATNDTSDNGRIAVLTGSSNLVKVYAQTSAGISTGWQNLAVARVYADTGLQLNGYRVEGAGTGTQSGQAIHVGQIDTNVSYIYQPATEGLLTLKLAPIGGAPATAYIAASGHDGIVVNYSKDADAVDGYHISKYESEWTEAAINTTYTLAHGLGAVPTIAQVFFSDSANGSGDVVALGAPCYADGVQRNSAIVDIDATNVVVRSGQTIADYNDSAGSRQVATHGYLKVAAVLVS